MDKKVLSEEQLAALAAEVVKAIREQIQAPQLPDAEDVEESPARQVRRGRPKSIYTGQIHIKVLPEDADWFIEISDQLGLQRGKFLNMLRKCFDAREINDLL